MRLTKFDIGGEIIAILTRGMYPNPKAALREYIQNAVDAKSKKVDVKIRQNSIVVDDNGIGMDYKVLRKAVRLGVSDKNPKKDVGFMGIGIYSAYHLCEKLVIYSRKEGHSPYRLTMNFVGMKEELEEQRSLRLQEEINDDELTDLQTLLEKHIDITNEGDISHEEFPRFGTRVELHGIENAFYDEVANFEDTAEYLRLNVPLKFDRDKFKYAELIENQIHEICKKNNTNFELIDLELQVNSQIEDLYRPYSDEDFHNESPNEPLFKELKKGKTFLGVSWACMNSVRRKIINKKHRGFLLRKQGFAVGTRESLLKYFQKQRTHYDRYIGEVIIVNPNLLPNASRDELEYSPLRTLFISEMERVAEEYDLHSDTFQENSKARELITEQTEALKKINKEFSVSKNDADYLIKLAVRVNTVKSKIKSKLKGKLLEQKTTSEARQVYQTAENIEKGIENRVKELAQIKKSSKTSKSTKKVKTPLQNAKDLSKIDTVEVDSKNYESLLELFKDLEYEFLDEFENILNLIDERFVQALAETKTDYYEILHELKQEIQNLD